MPYAPWETTPEEEHAELVEDKYSELLTDVETFSKFSDDMACEFSKEEMLELRALLELLDNAKYGKRKDEIGARREALGAFVGDVFLRYLRSVAETLAEAEGRRAADWEDEKVDHAYQQWKDRRLEES